MLLKAVLLFFCNIKRHAVLSCYNIPEHVDTQTRLVSESVSTFGDHAYITYIRNEMGLLKFVMCCKYYSF